MLFFVLSGFLMAYLYLEQPFGQRRLWRYAVARVARVVPLFAAVVGLSALLPRVGVSGVVYDLPTRPLVLSHVLLLSGKSILWTIPTELQFYFVFVVFWWVASRSPAASALAVLGAIALSLGFGTPRFRGEFASIPYDLRLAQVVPYFLVGMLFGIVYRRWSFPEHRQRSMYALVLLVIPVMYPQIFEVIFGFRHGLWNDPLVLGVVSVVFGVVLFAVPDESSILSNRVGDFLGQISYSLYLLHVPVMWAVRKLALPDTIRFAIFLVLSLVVAAVAFQVFERPMQRFLRRRLLGQSGY